MWIIVKRKECIVCYPRLSRFQREIHKLETPQRNSQQLTVAKKSYIVS